GDGSEWSVTPDWEEREGLRNDVFGVEEDKESTALHQRFKEDPWYLEIMDYLMGNMQSLSRFWLENGKLWKASTKATDRSAKVECIPCEEGLQQARTAHENNGHFAWDHTRLHLQDNYFWPTL
ncbi:hypothetical protein M422DRAFT_81064, partial [Sphaerobolus stellatus SS14]